MKDEGIAICHVDDFEDEHLIQGFNKVKSFYKKFTADSNVKERMLKYQRGEFLSTGNGKPFEINSFHYLNRDLDFGDGIVEFFLSDVILKIATNYLGVYPKSYVFNSWIHLPHKQKRVKSMNWHRDPEDTKIFKIYLAVGDISIQNGPFQYVKHSIVGDKYADLQEYRITNRYPKKGFIEENVDKNDIVSMIGKSGTLAFVDNYGFHRGGYVESGHRLLAQGVFLKPDIIKKAPSHIQRMSMNLYHENYKKLSPMAKYAINKEFFR